MPIPNTDPTAPQDFSEPTVAQEGTTVQTELNEQEQFNIDTAIFFHDMFTYAVESQENDPYSYKLTYPQFFNTLKVDAQTNKVSTEGLMPRKAEYAEKSRELIDKESLAAKGIDSGSPMMQMLLNAPRSKEIIFDKMGIHVIGSPESNFASQDISLLGMPKSHIKVLGEFLTLINDEKLLEIEEEKAEASKKVRNVNDIKDIINGV